MDGMSLSEEMDIKRVSMLSEHQFSVRDPKTKKTREELAPPDPFHLTFILFFIFGLGAEVPYIFFLTSQDYWMYKFRDTSLDTIDLRNKTMLQKNFVAVAGLAHTIPSILTTIVVSYFGHKVNIEKRLIGTIASMLAVFIIFTIFIEVNTDPWQFEFFVLTIMVSTGITVATGIFYITNLALIAKFPQQYLQARLYGQASSSILSSLLQILCLFMGNNSHTGTALIYFLCGTFILLVTVVCAVMSRHVPRFAYYLGDTIADTKRPTLSLREMKDLAKTLWPNIFILITATLTAGMGHPNITTMVVSENYGHGDPWADKYFEPTITFLLYYTMSLCGRFFARPLLTPKTAVWWVILDTMRYFFINPLYLFCNAQPRKHLPVLLPHDWEYIMVIFVGEFVNIFFWMSTFMSMKNMLPDRAEQGYLLMASLGSIAGIFFSILGTFWVNVI